MAAIANQGKCVEQSKHAASIMKLVHFKMNRDYAGVCTGGRDLTYVVGHPTAGSDLGIDA